MNFPHFFRSFCSPHKISANMNNRANHIKKNYILLKEVCHFEHVRSEFIFPNHCVPTMSYCLASFFIFLYIYVGLALFTVPPLRVFFSIFILLVFLLTFSSIGVLVMCIFIRWTIHTFTIAASVFFLLSFLIPNYSHWIHPKKLHPFRFFFFEYLSLTVYIIPILCYMMLNAHITIISRHFIQMFFCVCLWCS